MTTILDHTGQPYRNGGKTNGHVPRRELIDAMNLNDRAKRRSVEARYDAADRGSEEFANFWLKADSYSPDVSNSKSVRQALVSRSRYESESNGISDGIIQTHANYVVSSGPTLRMQTQSSGMNRWIEREWERWSKIVKLRRKLHCMAQAKTQDGEALAIVRNNPRLRASVKLDIVLIETEQCQTPMLPYAQVNYIDGIRFDEFGSPEWYDILQQHPGGATNFATANSLIPESVPARFVLHWFALRRPGLHRGVPELRSSLNVGASSRRMREATVSAVETAASLGACLLETDNSAFTAEEIAAGSSIDLKRRMMTALPNGYKAHQMASEFPNATYKDFQRSQLSEQARPISMPHNLAASDSSDHNFASGRLDFIPYYMQVDDVRRDGDDLVLDPLFDVWYVEAAKAFNWFAMPDGGSPPHSWDWPPHPVADQESEVIAKAKALQTGQLSPDRLFAAQGLDWDDEVPIMADNYFGNDEVSGMTPIERQREWLKLFRNTTFNSKAEQASILQVEENQQNQQAEPQPQGEPANA